MCGQFLLLLFFLQMSQLHITRITQEDIIMQRNMLFVYLGVDILEKKKKDTNF